MAGGEADPNGHLQGHAMNEAKIEKLTQRRKGAETMGSWELNLRVLRVNHSLPSSPRWRR